MKLRALQEPPGSLHLQKHVVPCNPEVERKETLLRIAVRNLRGLQATCHQLEVVVVRAGHCKVRNALRQPSSHHPPIVRFQGPARLSSCEDLGAGQLGVVGGEAPPKQNM